MMYFYFLIILLAVIIAIGLGIIKLVNYFKIKHYETLDSYMILEHTNDIVELAKENAWEWLVKASSGAHNIDITEIGKLTINALTDTTVGSFYDKMYSSDDTLKYISDDEMYEIIRIIISENYDIIIDFCRERSKELDDLDKTDITIPSGKENYISDNVNSSLADALNMFYTYDDDNTDNDV